MGDDRPDGMEWLTTGRSPTRRRAGSRAVAWAAALVAAVIVVAAFLVRDRPEVSSPPPGPNDQTTLPAPRSSPSAARTVENRRVTARRFDSRILGVRGDWELYGRGATELVRVQPAAGRVSVTGVPRLDSTGPVSFLVTGDTAVIRPLDTVAGYAVRDGGQVGPLPEALASGAALPGPEPGQVWAVDFDQGRTLLSLVRLRPPGPVQTVVVRGDLYGALAGDATGWFAYPLDGATFAYRSEGTFRAADGLLLAAGPRTWLVADCRGASCRPTVLDRRRTGRARVLRTPVENRWMSGLVSPDGRYAALLQTMGPAGPVARLLDLRTGAVEHLGIPLGEAYDLSGLVWAPDSRLLFLLDRQGRLWTVEPGRGAARPTGLGLPPLQQLAIKP